MNPHFKQLDKMPVLAMNSLVSRNTLGFDSSTHPQLKSFIEEVIGKKIKDGDLQLTEDQKLTIHNLQASVGSVKQELASFQSDITSLKDQINALNEQLNNLKQAVGQ